MSNWRLMGCHMSFEMENEKKNLLGVGKQYLIKVMELVSYL